MAELLSKYRLYLLMFCLNLAIVIGVIYLLRRPESRVVTVGTPAPRTTQTPLPIEIQVSGAVLNPGVYTMPAGARVTDGIQKAGGARPDADLTSLNLARKLQDGEQINIPTLHTPPAASAVQPPEVTSSAKININRATALELEALPHIGPALSKRIVDYRTQNGSFLTLEDIKKVKGIGDALFAEIKDLISVE